MADSQGECQMKKKSWLQTWETLRLEDGGERKKGSGKKTNKEDRERQVCFKMLKHSRKPGCGPSFIAQEKNAKAQMFQKAVRAA